MPTVDDFLLNRSPSFPLGATAENRTDLTLTQAAAPVGSVRGTVTNSVTGDRIANATVKLRTQSGDPVNHTETNPGGNYSLTDIVPGTYTINVALLGFVTSLGQTFTIQGGQNLTFDIAITPDARPQNVIYGVVSDQSSGLPISGAHVVLVPDLAIFENLTVVSSNATGQYNMCEISDSTASLAAGADGYYFSDFSTITISGATTVRSDITLQPYSLPQATVNGFIKTSNGTPIANACVGLYLLNTQGVEILQQVTFSDSNGFYLFGRATAGTYVVKAKSEKPAPAIA